LFDDRGAFQYYFDDFMDGIEDHLFDFFDGLGGDPSSQIDYDRHEENAEAPQDKPQAEGQDKQANQSQAEERPPSQRPSFRKYFSESRSSRLNGGDVVEERRERIANADGETRTVTMRRIGDRWHQEEIISDRDGKTSKKDSWHNIPESQMEQFSVEWEKKSLNHPPSVPSVTHDQAKKE
jgi:hypothetical protein